MTERRLSAIEVAMNKATAKRAATARGANASSASSSPNGGSGGTLIERAMNAAKAAKTSRRLEPTDQPRVVGTSPSSTYRRNLPSSTTTTSSSSQQRRVVSLEASSSPEFPRAKTMSASPLSLNTPASTDSTPRSTVSSPHSDRRKTSKSPSPTKAQPRRQRRREQSNTNQTDSTTTSSPNISSNSTSLVKRLVKLLLSFVVGALVAAILLGAWTAFEARNDDAASALAAPHLYLSLPPPPREIEQDSGLTLEKARGNKLLARIVQDLKASDLFPGGSRAKSDSEITVRELYELYAQQQQSMRVTRLAFGGICGVVVALVAGV